MNPLVLAGMVFVAWMTLFSSKKKKASARFEVGECVEVLAENRGVRLTVIDRKFRNGRWFYQVQDQRNFFIQPVPDTSKTWVDESQIGLCADPADF